MNRFYYMGLRIGWVGLGKANPGKQVFRHHFMYICNDVMRHTLQRYEVL